MGSVTQEIRTHYHLIGIGGIGMGAIASLLLARGDQVSGSDLKENDIIRLLRRKGATVFIGHKEENIDAADIVVYSSAVKEDNVEIKAARVKEKFLWHRAECLARFMQDKIGITAAGAHGKTTTSSMMARVLMSAGLDPTVMIGGMLPGNLDNASLGRSDYFVAELDESDGSFLSFTPRYSVITNIDREHLDHYKSFENLTEAYRTFIQKTQPGGLVWGYGDDARLRHLLEKSGTAYRTYGFSSKNDLWARCLVLDPFSSQFECMRQDQSLGVVSLHVPGRHNVANALATVGVGLSLGLSFESIGTGLSAFRGVRRRFEQIGDVNGILVIDDYAHHPSEIKAVLDTARAAQANRLIAVFQPHRYSRLSSLSPEFLASLTDCDYLIITDIYAASERPLPGVTAENFYALMKEKKPGACAYIPSGELVAHLSSLAQPGDMFLSLGAGNISQMFHDFVRVLTEKPVQEISLG